MAEDAVTTPDSAEAWLKAVMEGANTPERQAALKKASRAFHEAEITAATQEVAKIRKAAKLDPEGLATERHLGWAKGVAKAAGVPEAMLKYATDMGQVEEMLTDHQAGAPPEVKGEAPLSTTDEQVKAVLAKMGITAEQAKGRTPMMPAGGLPVAAISYKEILRSGKPLPSAAEIDRMTAGYAQ